MVCVHQSLESDKMAHFELIAFTLASVVGTFLIFAAFAH